MAHTLKDLLEKRVSVITNDGKNYLGILKGVDQKTNCVLSECEERVFSTTAGCEIVPLGLFIIRGDNMAIIGEVDEEANQRVDLSATKAPPLKPIVH